MTLFEMLVFTLCTFGSWQLCIAVQSWTRCVSSSPHWKMDRLPDDVIKTRNALECIYTCVQSADCRAIGYDGSSRTCSHYDRAGLFYVNNGTEYQSMAFIRNTEVIIARNIPKYQYTFEDAKTVCKDVGGTLLTEQKLTDLWAGGLQSCSCAWVAEEKRFYPMREQHDNCGGGRIGLIGCDYFKTADAWCAISLGT